MNILILASTGTPLLTRSESISNELKDVIYRHAAEQELPTALVIGILRILEHELLKEQGE